MNNIQQALFQTIETITEGKLSQIKFDKTLEALVTSDNKADVGEYELRYQDLIFTAYSSNNTVRYKKDTNVLVLVPEGDMGKRKTIISSSAKEGEKYVDFDQIVDRLGVNLVDEAKDFEIELSTTFDETVSFNIKKQTMIDAYPSQRYLSIGAELFTDISNEDIDGLYGIAVDCTFVNDKGERIPHTFEFNTLNVTGNPFQSRGYKETQIPLVEGSLVEVVGARAFSKGFSAGNEKIKFKNINIEYVNIREEDKSEYTGNIISPKGLNFRNNILYPDEKLLLIMEFKQRGIILDTKGIDYKWFVLNAEVNSVEHPNYHPDAGIGWEWMLQKNYEESVISGLETQKIEVSSSFVTSFATVKCIATYTDRKARVGSEVTLVDYTENIKAELDSSNGVSFVNGDGQTVLTCNVYENMSEVSTPMEYTWTQVKENGDSVLISKGDKKSIVVSASTIGMKSNFSCLVKSIESGKDMARGQITLVNVIDGSSHGLVIVGGFRTALYDGDGSAPTEMSKDGFQFDVYDNGVKVTSGLDWTWSIPSVDKTLLTIENPTVSDDGSQSTKNKVLYLGLVSKFDYNKSRNTIRLEVKYTKNGLVYTLVDYATVSITKVGQNGADGAAGKPGQDGSVYVYEIQGGSPVISYNELGEEPLPSTLNEFVLMFSKDGDITLANQVERVEWELPSKDECALSFSGLSNSIRRITTSQDVGGGVNNPHRVTLVADSTWDGSKFNNYLSAKITYKDMVFREYYPVSITKSGSSGVTITTNPSNYSIPTEYDGYVKEDVSIVVNFDIYKNNNIIENFDIFSIGAPNGIVYEIVQERKLKVTFKQGYDLPDNGIINVDLKIGSAVFTQSISFSKARGGESPYFLVVNSSNGLVFKQGDISTILYAIVFKGDSVVNDSLPSSAFIWQKIDKNGNIVENWIPSYVNNRKDKIVITPGDILERATFNCILEI